MNLENHSVTTDIRNVKTIGELLTEHPLIQHLRQMKKKSSDTITMRLNIELADNGIIIRDRDCPDAITLATAKGDWRNEDHSDEHTAVGKRVYEWLMDVVLGESDPSEILVTGFDIDINARCIGRGK